MELSRLRLGEVVAGAGAATLLVALLALDWFEFSGAAASGWDSLELLRFLLLVVVALAFTLVALTLLARPVAIPVAAAVVTTGTAIVAVLALLYRVGLDEPGDNALVEVELGAYIGLAAVTAVAAGGWRTMQDERMATETSRRQTDRVLAVRGAPRPPPPERDPERPSRNGDEDE